MEDTETTEKHTFLLMNEMFFSVVSANVFPQHLYYYIIDTFF
jgi:hypothetical protein